MANQDVTVVQGYIRVLPRVSGKEEASVTLVTEDEKEYRILHKGIGVDLLEHISAKVTISGVIASSEEGDTILVRNYTLTDGFEDEWYDDEPD